MARKKFEGGQISCSFCGKTQREVRKLIAGPTVYICNECIQLCTEIIDEERNSDDANKEERPLPTPHEITAYLDNYVIGQERAKKVLSVAIYNHYKRILSIESIASKKDEGEGSSTDSKMEDKTNGKGAKGKQVEEQHKQKTEHSGVELQKSNVLLVGPTGTGKTLLAQTLAKIIDVPFTMADATTLTEAGYVGEDVENILAGLLAAADNDVERAERGIIYIDEIDKIAGGSDSPSMTRDVSGEGVQQALLKIIEGTVANIPPRGGKKYGQTEMTSLDTTNILVICGGSFTGIEDVIQRRVGKQGMGFGGDIKSKKKQRVGEYLQKIEPQDLNKFGLIPEFIGRLPVLTTLDDLDETDLSYILTKPKNALLKQYKKLFSLEQVELIFSADAIAAITVEATKRRTGARGLRAILEEAMLEIMYEVPFLEGIKSCEITAEVIAGTGDPKLTFHILKSA